MTLEQAALDEALADIFASNVDGNWQLGEGSRGGAIRSLSNPAASGGARDVAEYVHDDPHASSTIVSHAYFLLASHIGRTGAERFVWEALRRNHYQLHAGFAAFEHACVKAAEGLYGRHAREWRATRFSFASVGLHKTWRPHP